MQVYYGWLAILLELSLHLDGKFIKNEGLTQVSASSQKIPPLKQLKDSLGVSKRTTPAQKSIEKDKKLPLRKDRIQTKQKDSMSSTVLRGESSSAGLKLGGEWCIDRTIFKIYI